jgi:hypothetical protein
MTMTPRILSRQCRLMCCGSITPFHLRLLSAKPPMAFEDLSSASYQGRHMLGNFARYITDMQLGCTLCVVYLYITCPERVGR